MEYGTVLVKRFWPNNSHSFRYRCEVVPDTGRRMRRYGRWLKRMSHAFNERRIYHAHREYVRPKRSTKNLPNPWDDITRADLLDKRSWKKKKLKKQWMKHLK